MVLAVRPQLPVAVLAGMAPGMVWAGQLSGLAGSGLLRWPVELRAGVVIFSVLSALAVAWLTQPARATQVAVENGEPGGQTHPPRLTAQRTSGAASHSLIISGALPSAVRGMAATS
jgi:hypothetical protein